jgi:dihydrofolate reductase
MQQEIIAIYAVSENGVIGRDNDLPWDLPDDMKHFMRLSKGKAVIMGRRSFEALGKPLPQRRNLVITRDAAYRAEGIETAPSLEAALERCASEPVVVIAGGAGVYREAIEKGYVTRIYETLVHAEVEGETRFTLPDPDQWEVAEVDARQADHRHEHAFTFRTLVRKAAG